MPEDNTVRSTRRAFIGGLAAAGTVGLAGCGALSGSQDTLPTPVRGDPDADVTVAVFKDYACGHCARYTLDVFPDLVSEYIRPGTIRYEQYDFPIPLSEESWRAPNAARAVQDTVGEDAYWEYSHALYANQDRLGLALYAELAEQVGADPDTVRSAAAERTYDATVKADRQLGIDRGVRATPTIFVNGSPLDSYAYDVVTRAIESAR
ncbi:MAG: DsbA family protein [Halorhabdus sp.]